MDGLSRRELALGALGGVVLGRPAAAQAPAPTVALPGGGTAPALGQGTWHLAQGRHPAAEEEQALRTGLAEGMSLIDTAELYGGGRAEELVARVIAGPRSRVFVVSKVMPQHATPPGIRAACEASLARLGTDHLDIYLLHWRGGVRDLFPVVATFEELRRAGRIRRWGVSNFGVSDMEELFAMQGGNACAVNQVRYSLESREAEARLLPWCAQHGVPIMAYSPLGSGSGLLRNPALARVAARLGVSPAAVAIAWTMRAGRAISIPESGSPAHVKENAAALTLRLGAEDQAELDRAFPA